MNPTARNIIALSITAFLLGFVLIIYTNTTAFEYKMLGTVVIESPPIQHENPFMYWLAMNQVYIFMVLLAVSAFIIDWKKIAIYLNKINNKNNGV